MKNFRTRIGQFFVLGFPGETVPLSLLDFLREEQIGGVILFEENCQTHEMARENIRLINSYIREIAPLIAIDQEGGPVVRLRGVPVEIRSAAEYGKDGNLEHFREDYARAVVLMGSLGINLNLAPVADLQLNKRNKCLKDRCFSGDPLVASEFVKVSVEVAQQKGILSCLKHFPGLGAATLDPHAEVAQAVYDCMVWPQRDRIPFAAGIEAGADLIMTTHLMVPSLDDKLATESPRIVTEMIRTDLGFEGTVITDDLCMQGAVGLGDLGERAVKAFMAGHDLLLFCHDYDEVIEGYEYFVGAVDSGEIPAERVRTALDRVAGLKLKLGQPVPR